MVSNFRSACPFCLLEEWIYIMTYMIVGVVGFVLLLLVLFLFSIDVIRVKGYPYSWFILIWLFFFIVIAIHQGLCFMNVL